MGRISDVTNGAHAGAQEGGTGGSCPRAQQARGRKTDILWSTITEVSTTKLPCEPKVAYRDKQQTFATPNEHKSRYDQVCC